MPRPWTALTDDQMVIIATAPPAVSAGQLARQLGVNRFTVIDARQRLQKDGGWVCALVWIACAVCGLPAAVPSTRRTMHPACVHVVRNQRKRERYPAGRREQIARAKAWQAANPDKLAALRDQHKERQRDKYADLPEPAKAPLIAAWRERTQQDQATTRPHAGNSGARWTADDLAYLIEQWDRPARDVALELGRTLYAVHWRRQVVRMRRGHDADGSDDEHRRAPTDLPPLSP